MNLDSTILPQKADPVEISKMGIDLLSKMKQLAALIPGASTAGMKAVSAAYTFQPTDGVTDLFVTTGASTITVTLTRSAENPGRLVRVWKADSGVGEVKVVGNTTGSVTQTISGHAAVYAGLQYQHVDIYQDGTTNFNVGQYLQSVAGEPSLGTPHEHTDGVDRAAVDGSAGSAGWTEVDCSSLCSVGTKALEASVIVRVGNAAAGVQTVLSYCFSPVNTFTPTLKNCRHIYHEQPGIATISGAYSTNKQMMIPLNSARKFYYYRLNNTSTATPLLYVYICGEHL